MVEAMKNDGGKPKLSMIPSPIMKEVSKHMGDAAITEAITNLSVIGNGLYSIDRLEAALRYVVDRIIVSYIDERAAAGVGPAGILNLLNDCAAAMELGEKKYSRNNWQNGIKYSRLVDAALRHLAAWEFSATEDEESGYDHRGHALFCCGALLHYIQHNKGENDLIKEKVKE